MNAVEFVKNALDERERYYKEQLEEIAKEREYAEHLPKELAELNNCAYVDYWKSGYCLVRFADDSVLETLKMAGVVGLKRTFNGKYTGIEDDWVYEGGELQVGEYLYHIAIGKAQKPTSCRIEEQEVVEPERKVKKLVAICPETQEEL